MLALQRAGDGEAESELANNQIQIVLDSLEDRVSSSSTKNLATPLINTVGQ